MLLQQLSNRIYYLPHSPATPFETYLHGHCEPMTRAEIFAELAAL